MSHRFCPVRQAALEAPHAIAFRSKTEQLTYLELDEKINETVTLLSSYLSSEEIVAVHLPPSLLFICLLFSSIRIGAPFCPLNLRLPKIQIDNQIRELRPKLLIDSSGWHTYTDPQHSSSSFFLFTSGSTAAPKCARFSLDNFLANAQGIQSVLDLQKGDAWLLSLPLYHVGGLGIVFRSVLARAQIVLDPTFEKITHLSYVPTQLYRAWPIYRHLRTLMLGGAPIIDIPPKLPIVSTYGLTEMGSAVLATRTPVWKEGALYLGFALPGREIKVENEELFVRGPCLFQGYGTESQTEWFPTRDIVRYDPKLGLAIIGRKDNQFISGGENIQPEEIEQVLLSHPSVLEALIIPKQDAEFGARPVAFVKTIDSSFNLKKMHHFLEERLPKYKLPIALYPMEETEFKPDRKKFLSFLNKELFF